MSHYDVCDCGNRKRRISRACMACHLAERPASNLRLTLEPDLKRQAGETARDVSWWAEGNPTACRDVQCGAPLTIENVRNGCYCSKRCMQRAYLRAHRNQRRAQGLTAKGKPRKQATR